MGFKLYIACENGGRFFSLTDYATQEQAERARKYVAASANITEAAFGIAQFCDVCGKEKPIYSEGCCKSCFEKFVSAVSGEKKK